MICPGCTSSVPEGSRYCPVCGLSLSGVPPAGEIERTTDASDDPPSDPGNRVRFIPGHVLGKRYRIVERIGAGGMGEVYLAHDLILGGEVALKFLPAGLEGDPERLQRFFAEVKLAQKISHPTVAKVHQLEQLDGLYVLSMAYVDGEDLASLLRRIGRLPADRAEVIARQMCEGLAAIHQARVLHRDLKPANVMIDGRGHALITDFGLAEVKGATSDEEQIVGTPAYMAPEVLESKPADERSDLYSLGLVLYELFTGRSAYVARSWEELRRVRRKPPPPPSSLVRDVHPAIERLIMRCLERDPTRRPQSAAAAAAALPGRDLVEVAIAAGETPSPQMIADSRERLEGFHPATAWACLTAFLVGGALLIGLSPHTRVVPAAPLNEPPSVMAVRARDLIARFGPHAKVRDHAQGFTYREQYVGWIATADSSRSRWNRVARTRPPVVTYWYRESPLPMVASGRESHVEWDDPPRLVPGMASVELDPAGRLRRLHALPTGYDAPADSALDWAALFGAAGLEMARFHPGEVELPPPTMADSHAAWNGADPDDPSVSLHVEVASFRGRPVYFAVREPWEAPEGLRSRAPDPSGVLTSKMILIARPLMYVIVLIVGGWLARRNLRAGRGDRLRATRVALTLMAMRILIWVIGAHHTADGDTGQLIVTIALALYDFVFGWVFYIAVEPYFRRLWPRVLRTWVRLVNGEFHDAQVGRDLLVGCLVGVALSLAVALHQLAPTLLGYPPGRPDNVGFVEHELAALSGFLQQVADLLWVQRSALILAMEFVVMLVMARLVVRRLSLLVTFLLFIPFALPKGDSILFNFAFAALSLGLVFFVMMRLGLLPAIVALLVNSMLQSTPLKWEPGGWAYTATLVVILLVVGVAMYGFVRSLAGRPAIHDVFPKEV
jgi:serine/threonine-protein kinase